MYIRGVHTHNSMHACTAKVLKWHLCGMHLFECHQLKSDTKVSIYTASHQCTLNPIYTEEHLVTWSNDHTGNLCFSPIPAIYYLVHLKVYVYKIRVCVQKYTEKRCMHEGWIIAERQEARAEEHLGDSFGKQQTTSRP